MAEPQLPRLILASNSPRRAALLREAGYPFVVVAPDPASESGPRPGESAEALVARLALEKASQIADLIHRSAGRTPSQLESYQGARVILAADTVAECEREILGKPIDRDHARQMLQQLSGTSHRVWTGVCLWHIEKSTHRSETAVTTLQMLQLSQAEIDSYLERNLWCGKAGAFGYQDGNDWIQILAGSSSNVVGLPLELLPSMFAALGVDDSGDESA